MSNQGYKDLVDNFAAIKGINKDQAVEIISRVVKDFYREISK